MKVNAKSCGLPTVARPVSDRGQSGSQDREAHLTVLIGVCGNRHTLRGGTDNDLADVDVGRLLDGERDRARDRFRRDRKLIPASSSRAFTAGLVTASTKSVRTKPGVMIVTLSLSPASWRKPSEMARTANFVPE